MKIPMDRGLKEMLTPLDMEQIKKICNGKAEIYEDDSLYIRLFDYYLSTGDMPYGTAKARTGDPDQWILNRLLTDLGY